MKSLFSVIFMIQTMGCVSACLGLVNLAWVTTFHPPFDKFTHFGMTVPAAICVSLNGGGVFMLGQLFRIVLSKFSK